MFLAKKSCYPPDNLVSKEADELTDEPKEDVLNFDLIRNWAKLSMETMEDRLQRYLDYFTVRTPELILLADTFEHELQLGLEAFPESRFMWQPKRCSFKMLDACIKSLPTGKEKGVYYALDFGGTNFRVVRAEMADGKVKTSQLKMSLKDAAEGQDFPKGLLDRRASATKMFNFFGRCSRELMEQEGDAEKAKDKPLAACFTFSFPCAQHLVNSATLIEWTKGFETGRGTKDPVEGLDVAQLTEAGFQRSGAPLYVAGVVNDTVGTLLSSSYEMDHKEHPPCLIGLILGTGVNACYYEAQAPNYGYKGQIINIECGNFNRGLPLTNVDHELDFIEASNRGRQRLEKMIAGAYLGELCRRAIVKVLQNLAPEAAWKPYSFTSEDVSAVVADNSEDFGPTETRLQQVWGAQFCPLSLAAIRQLCLKMMDRSAALSAVIIAGVARKTQHLQPAMGGLSVAIDGSLYKCVPYFRERIRHHLDAIVGEQTGPLIHMLMADDGSGKGAAVLAACLAESAN